MGESGFVTVVGAGGGGSSGSAGFGVAPLLLLQMELPRPAGSFVLFGVAEPEIELPSDASSDSIAGVDDVSSSSGGGGVGFVAGAWLSVRPVGSMTRVIRGDGPCIGVAT